MAEQIMWAVKGPDDRILINTMDKTENWAKISFLGGSVDRWREFEAAGYRCIRVKVTEVEGA